MSNSPRPTTGDSPSPHPSYEVAFSGSITIATQTFRLVSCWASCLFRLVQLVLRCLPPLSLPFKFSAEVHCSRLFVDEFFLQFGHLLCRGLHLKMVGSIGDRLVAKSGSLAYREGLSKCTRNIECERWSTTVALTYCNDFAPSG